MKSPRTFLRNLKNLQRYLSGFSQSKQPAAFEYLTVRTLSCILHLPFYSADNDNPSVNHRVVWNGNYSNMIKSPRGPDGIAYAHDFYIIIEATLKRETTQWQQEFAQCIRHIENFIRTNNLNSQDVYGLLVVPKLHIDTYRSIRQRPRQQFNVILLETSNLTKILETSILACTLRNLELRILFNRFPDFLRPSAIKDFLKRLEDGLANWQKDVLEIEKRCFVGIKSYEVIKKIGRPSAHTSEILNKLQKHPVVNRYLNIIDETITFQLISESLISENLAFVVGKLPNTEEDFCPVAATEFKHRIDRVIKIVEKINKNN